MKKIILSLILIGLVSLIIFKLSDSLTIWTQHGQNDFRNMIVLFTGLLAAKPIAYLINGLVNLFISEPKPGI